MTVIINGRKSGQHLGFPGLGGPKVTVPLVDGEELQEDSYGSDETDQIDWDWLWMRFPLGSHHDFANHNPKAVFFFLFLESRQREVWICFESESKSESNRGAKRRLAREENLEREREEDLSA
ncbi:hypothetical protein SLA2020_386180 [Shorea laevis]